MATALCPRCGTAYTTLFNLEHSCVNCGNKLSGQSRRIKRLGVTNSDNMGCAAVIAICLCLLIIVGVGMGLRYLINRQSDLAEQQRQERFAQAAEQQAASSRPLTVKGLYIGLSYQSLPEVIAKKFDSGKWQIENGNYPYCYIKNLGLEQMRNSYLPSGYMPDDLKTEASIKIDVTFDSTGELAYIYIPHRCAAYLFGSSGMTAGEFCQNFVNAYPVPTMNSDVGDDGVRFWKCTMPDNVTVKITGDKDVYIERAASQSAVRSKFN